MGTTLIVLPGFSFKNNNWAEEIERDLSPRFEVNIWQWKHWKTGDKSDFSVESEVSEIITQLETYEHQAVFVLAKSIGTFVVSKILQQSPDLFDKIILCGIPLNDLEPNEWDEYQNLKLASSQSICFQNDKDPHGNFAQVSKFFKEEGILIPVVEKIADNHDYCYSSDFISFLSA